MITHDELRVLAGILNKISCQECDVRWIGCRFKVQTISCISRLFEYYNIKKENITNLTLTGDSIVISKSGVLSKENFESFINPSESPPSPSSSEQSD